MAKVETRGDVAPGDYAIELTRDLGFRGAHLGKGYVLDGTLDYNWARHLVTMGDAKEVDMPAGGYEDPPPWALPPEMTPLIPTVKHPTEARAHADARHEPDKPDAKKK